MPKTRWSLAACALGVLAACGGASSGQTAVGGEVVETQIKLDLPAPPDFQAPQPNPDGTHAALEMRRFGSKYLEQDVKLKGFVVFKYDCIAVLGEKVYKDTPDKCERPHFYIADQPNGSIERAVWVVEVPRAPREDEKKVLPKEELKNPELWPPEPVYSQGDEVVVDGKWATKSPRGFVNSEGLLVFKAMTVVTPINPEPVKKGR
jgi:hypothetical protein